MAVVIPVADQAYRRLRLLPLLGGRAAASTDLLISSNASTPFADSFRLLALNVRTLLTDAPRKAVAVISGYPGDGRSLVAANLSIALAEHGSVLLIDGDGRNKDSISRLLLPSQVKNGRDLPERDAVAIPPFMLMRSAGLARPLDQDASVRGDPRVWLMPAEHRRDGGISIEATLEAASGVDAYVVVDSPAATVSSDAFAIAQKVGHALYVVRRRVQDMAAHRQIRDQLARLNARTIGIVMNEF